MAAAGLIGWLVGAGARGRQTDAAAVIWEAINDAARAAMQADTDALPAHAAELQRVLRARLGHTLDFAGDLNGRVKALGGEIEDASAPAPPVAPPVAAAAADKDAPTGGGAAAAAAASVTIVSVHPQPAATPAAAPPPAKPGKRPLSTKERNDALRLAVAALNDHWRHRKARETEMRAVIAELCDPGPRRPRLSHGGGGHGH